MGERTKKLLKRTLTDQEVIKLYVKGKSTTEIGKCANVSSRYVRMVLHKHNVEMRSFESESIP
ncbi:hypothetical protein [Virgibacillus subterraneus]|uniref:hypothetical protein n=1 Tax=Virgibacillus subterraneus TaxID=621109 RepID=UPI001FE0B100|nr:hypothetical protein [Virgibacillus subterraneus]